MTKYVAYYRVSSKQQGDSGLGLASQKQIVSHYTKDQCDKEFTEVMSGKNIIDRPVLREAIAYCLKNDCTLVVAKLDRLSRDVEDAREVLETLKGKLWCCDLPYPIHKFMLTLFAAVAELEREHIAIRTKGALQAKLKKDGKWQLKAGETTKNGKIASPAILDGSAQKAAAEAKRLAATTNENNIRAKELIHSLVSEGRTFGQIAHRLNEKKFLTSRNNPFTYAQTKRLYLR